MTRNRIDRTFDGLLPEDGVGRRELALGGRFVEPRDLVTAAAVAYRLRADGHEVRVSCGRDRAVYVSRMHLGQALEDIGAVHDLRRVREFDHAGDLLEVVRLWSAADARRLAALVHGKVVNQDAAPAEALWACLTEFGSNVQDHAVAGLGVSAPGYSAAQTMPRSKEVVFAVADPGVGL